MREQSNAPMVYHLSKTSTFSERTQTHIVFVSHDNDHGNTKYETSMKNNVTPEDTRHGDDLLTKDSSSSQLRDDHDDDDEESNGGEKTAKKHDGVRAISSHTTTSTASGSTAANQHAADDVATLSHTSPFRPPSTAAPENAPEDSLSGFLQIPAKRVARNPCTHLWASLAAAVGISLVAVTVGKLQMGTDSTGWTSRGTMIADRQSQVGLVNAYRDQLSTGDSAVWNHLIHNVQPGWELGRDGVDDDGDDNRVRRNLQSETERLSNAIDGCDLNVYFNDTISDENRLWPVWQPSGPYDTALDPAVLEEICIAEQNSLRVLEDNGVCDKCADGGTACMPPLSIVLYARLQIEDGFAMTCSELAQLWAPLQAATEDNWQECVAAIKSDFDPQTQLNFPNVCPFGFHPAMVNADYDVTKLASSTSSVFWTRQRDLHRMYEFQNQFDRGSSAIVNGKYDSDGRHFVDRFKDDILKDDAPLVVAAAALVIVAILAHTRSPFLTMIGLLQILFSFPLAYFVIRLVLGYEFFPSLNYCALFVVFAIGADDIFVAVDKWKNTRLAHPAASVEYIAAIALPDAAGAMFLTTITTSVAFFATAICPVAPVKLFSILCGTMVIFDYIMDVLIMFPALCIYDNHIQLMASDKRPSRWMIFEYSSSSSWTKQQTETVGDGDEKVRKDARDSVSILHNDDNDITTDIAHVETGDGQKKTEQVLSCQEDVPAQCETEHHSLIERILLGYYAFAAKSRWMMLLFSLTAIAVTGFYASKLDLPSTSVVQPVSSKYEYQASYEWRNELLYHELQRANGGMAYVIWGVNPADTGDHDNPATWTSLELDAAFDPSSEAAQLYFLEFCDDLYGNDFAFPTPIGYVCAFNRFDQWLQAESQMNETSMVSDIYALNCDGATGIPMSPESFDRCISAWAADVKDTSILSRDGIVEIIVIPFGSTVQRDNAVGVLKNEWHLIEDWMDAKNDEAPDGCNRAYFSSVAFWWYDTITSMFRTAYGSASIALLAAMIMLLLTSRSIVLTIYSTLTIGYVLTSVTATLVAMGWTLGLLESICFSVLVGISCDFVLHFSHAYATHSSSSSSNMNESASKEMRTRHALLKMGPSILAAGFTTMASAVVMLFTINFFFHKFGFILFMTVLQATVGAFVIFTSIVLCIGPSEPTKLFDTMIGKKKKSDERQPTERTMSQNYSSSRTSSLAAFFMEPERSQ
mmetsp:Transcript_5011/g.14599  ORF Transcript_5011/g.14599 Transcript_5011/m.14599 type:complete len:1206 (+) Transcript_5011:1375-4992(+)